jgi:hypothetical protein
VGAAVVVMGHSCSATPGLAAAWRCRGWPVPPWHAVVLRSRYVRIHPLPCFFLLCHALLLELAVHACVLLLHLWLAAAIALLPWP